MTQSCAKSQKLTASYLTDVQNKIVLLLRRGSAKTAFFLQCSEVPKNTGTPDHQMIQPEKPKR